jgi:uncharacterized damage-inducible protein DinB
MSNPFMKLPLTLLLPILLQNLTFGQSYFRSDYPGVWQRATAYTLEVAEAMPADRYGFKPPGESMNFQEQMVHLIQNLSFLSGQVTGTRPDFLRGQNPALLSKAEVSAVLQQALQHVSGLIQTTDDETLRENITFGGEKMPKENIFYLMRDHMTHHRAQAVLYLRLNGMEPPKYRGW